MNGSRGMWVEFKGREAHCCCRRKSTWKEGRRTVFAGNYCPRVWSGRGLCPEKTRAGL